jgi:hypothetical protein
MNKGVSMALVLNCSDPRGWRIVMYDNRYWHHIASRRSHISINAIQAVIEDPEIITADEQNDLRENYYATGVMEDYPEFFLKVVVEFGGMDGKVITAFDVDRPKPTERIVWQPQS